MEIKEIAPGSKSESDYRAVIDESPDSTVLHTLEWRAVLADTLGDSSHYFVCYEDGLPAGTLPSFVRKTELGSVFNSLAFSGSYGGVCIRRGCADPEAVREALLKRALDFAHGEGCLTATFIMSPLSYSQKEKYIGLLNPDFIYDRITQFTHLAAPLDYKPSVKNHISKAKRLGVALKREITPENVDCFYRIYLSNMEYLGLAPKPRKFFDSIIKHMEPSGMARFYFAFAEENIVSGALTFQYRNGVKNHETCFERSFKKYQGNSYLLDEALKEAKSDGYEYFNWGASESRESGVYQFKAAWGAVEMPYSYFTCILHDCSSLRAAGPKNILSTFGRFYYVIPFGWLD
jgi:hypothetical protein